ncbi:hypothetical protein BF93_03750 [Brachybacterium phenoliresistens]|uniref:Thioredoxin-like fold domain-containing protein n=1 Tax=Brachybacterium phenoliresistens TaxID=396014 RepID=Z9JR73_9MICO|nr:thioredoxin domain-containing protein [Brachybacterium phenoliresistens]EWS80306.1 hypothetical protein BF93_03750 [Brachybacterium phenoliresistens]
MPAAPARSKAPVIIIAAVCAVLLLGGLVLGAVGLGSYVMLRDGDGAPGPDGPAPSPGVQAPAGVAADGTSLQLGSDSSLTVEVYLDYSCPHCAEFSRINDEDLRMLAEDGTIDLRIHPLPMLNASSAGYSERAANAATCVHDEDPGLFWEMSTALFEAQADGPALSSEDLAETAHGLGAGEETVSCITAETYLPWINEVVGPEATDRIPGTPTVYIDGEQFSGDYTVEDELLHAIVGE